MKKSLFTILLMLFAFISKGQTVLTINNNTTCNMFVYMQLMDGVTYPGCGGMLACSPVSVGPGTTTFNAAAMDANGYNGTSYSWSTGNSRIGFYVVRHDPATLCFDGVDVGVCSSNGQNNWTPIPNTCSCNSNVAISIMSSISGGADVLDIQ